MADQFHKQITNLAYGAALGGCVDLARKADNNFVVFGAGILAALFLYGAGVTLCRLFSAPVGD